MAKKKKKMKNPKNDFKNIIEEGFVTSVQVTNDLEKLLEWDKVENKDIINSIPDTDTIVIIKKEDVLEKFYNDILDKKYEGYAPYINEYFVIKNAIVEYSEKYDYNIYKVECEDIYGNIKLFNLTSTDLVEKLPLKWKIKHFLNKIKNIFKKDNND